MNCPTCGTVLADGSPFCSTCGANLGNAPPPGMPAMPYQQPYAQPMVMPRNSGMAIAGFVLALLSCSLLGLIFSIIGYSECKKSMGTVKGEGLALAGIIISIVWILFSILYFAASSHHSY
jgi:hypothetical protein